MNLPKLHVIIPTLKRPDTLYWTLKTVLEQDYSNFEVLVSDNFSNDTTREVVYSFNDKRVSYIKTDKKLSMSHHWEFALSHIADGYVTVLGDDDGILPGSLTKIAGIIEKHKPEAIGWRFGNYNWKGLPPYFMIPMGNTYRVVNPKAEAEIIFNKSIYSTIEFPSLYGGFINKKLINTLKEKYDGSFFHSRIPDFFSGAIIAANVQSYIRVNYPITINATSKHSTGFATVSNDTPQNAFDDLRKNDDSNIPFYPDLFFFRSNAIPIAEAMLQAHKLEPTFPKVNIEKVLKESMKEAVVCESKEKYDEIVAGIKKIGILNNIEDFTSNLISEYNYQGATLKVKNKFSPVTNTLYLDTTSSGIENVYDACKAASLFTAKTLHISNNSSFSKLESLKGFFRCVKAKSSPKYRHYFKT